MICLFSWAICDQQPPSHVIGEPGEFVKQRSSKRCSAKNPNASAEQKISAAHAGESPSSAHARLAKKFVVRISPSRRRSTRAERIAPKMTSAEKITTIAHSSQRGDSVPSHVFKFASIHADDAAGTHAIEMRSAFAMRVQLSGGSKRSGGAAHVRYG